MKKAVRVFGFALITVIYFLTINSVDHSSLSAFSSNGSSEKEAFFSGVSQDLICLSARPGISLSSFNNYTPPASKSGFKFFTAVASVAEFVFAKCFKQYAAASKNFPVRLRKADFLFPFHYFW